MPARPANGYGCEEFGRLESVLLHTPGRELSLVNARNRRYWLFDAVPDPGRFIEEHRRYRQLLVANGVRVYELGELVRKHQAVMARLPNLTYLHDTAVISRFGAILSAMALPARQGEEKVVGEALASLKIPVWISFRQNHADAFEGCLLLSPDTILMVETERHNPRTVARFLNRASQRFSVIYARIPRRRRFMHADTVFNRVKKNLALAYLPAFRQVYFFSRGRVRRVDFPRFLQARGIEVIGVTDAEQKQLACSFVPLREGVLVHYEQALSAATRRRLGRRKVELIFFRPRALLAGGGSLRCLTLRLKRQREE